MSAAAAKDILGTSGSILQEEKNILTERIKYYQEILAHTIETRAHSIGGSDDGEIEGSDRAHQIAETQAKISEFQAIIASAVVPREKKEGVIGMGSRFLVDNGDPLHGQTRLTMTGPKNVLGIEGGIACDDTFGKVCMGKKVGTSFVFNGWNWIVLEVDNKYPIPSTPIAAGK